MAMLGLNQGNNLQGVVEQQGTNKLDLLNAYLDSQRGIRSAIPGEERGVGLGNPATTGLQGFYNNNPNVRPGEFDPNGDIALGRSARDNQIFDVNGQNDLLAAEARQKILNDFLTPPTEPEFAEVAGPPVKGELITRGQPPEVLPGVSPGPESPPPQTPYPIPFLPEGAPNNVDNAGMPIPTTPPLSGKELQEWAKGQQRQLPAPEPTPSKAQVQPGPVTTTPPPGLNEIYGADSSYGILDVLNWMYNTPFGPTGVLQKGNEMVPPLFSDWKPSRLNPAF